MHKRDRGGEKDKVPQREEEAGGKTEEERETKEGRHRGRESQGTGGKPSGRPREEGR